MDKLSQLKQALKNPPPERLMRIEYKSHLYQAIGITFVCGMLIYKGFWYIIFALIFGLGISYSQGMTAYKRYQFMMEFKEPEKLEDIEKDISFTRRRSRIINSSLGSYPNIISIISSVVITMLVVNPTWNRWVLMLVYPICILVFYLVLYFYFFYWIAYLIHKEKLKGGKKKNE